MESWILTRLEEDAFSKKTQECPEREKSQVSTMFQKSMETFVQKKELIKSFRYC